MAKRVGRFKLPKNKCKKVLSKRPYAKRSPRWIKRKSTYLLIACPRGKWNAKTERCKVGTFAVEEVKASRKGAACPVGYRKRR